MVAAGLGRPAAFSRPAFGAIPQTLRPIPGLHARPQDATLFTSSGWNRAFKTGADGRVTIETPWPGPAILEVSHVEPKPGEHAGLPHESIRHVFTLSFTVPAAG